MCRKLLRTKQGKAIMISVLVAGVALWPIPSLESPEWKIRVEDRTGKPVQDVIVREWCKNYSAEFVGHEVDLRPDSEGRVTFSRSVIRVSIVKRLLVMANSATQGAHASFGLYCSVLAFNGNIDSFTPDWNGSPPQLESTIVAERHVVSVPVVP